MAIWHTQAESLVNCHTLTPTAGLKVGHMAINERDSVASHHDSYHCCCR